MYSWHRTISANTSLPPSSPRMIGGQGMAVGEIARDLKIALYFDSPMVLAFQNRVMQHSKDGLRSSSKDWVASSETNEKFDQVCWIKTIPRLKNNEMKNLYDFGNAERAGKTHWQLKLMSNSGFNSFQSNRHSFRTFTQFSGKFQSQLRGNAARKPGIGRRCTRRIGTFRRDKKCFSLSLFYLEFIDAGMKNLRWEFHESISYFLLSHNEMWRDLKCANALAQSSGMPESFQLFSNAAFFATNFNPAFGLEGIQSKNIIRLSQF